MELEVGPIAHGGHCVARFEGRVVFVRHALPGERVLAQVTDRNRRYWRADAVQVLANPSPDRVPSAWPAAGPGGVGGGELAHVSLDGQRRWKAAVVAEQLRRLAGVDDVVEVEALPGETTGLGYRTRAEFVAAESGRLGMSGFRSNAVHPLDEMPLAVPALARSGLLGARFPAGARVSFVAPSVGEPVVLVDGRPVRHPGTAPRDVVRERVNDDELRVPAAGFWQVHHAAAAALRAVVLDGLAGLDVQGGSVVELYSGAGLFTRPLAQAVGPGGTVVAVEGDVQAARAARRNAHDLPWVRLITDDVAKAVGNVAGPVRAVVLDPPRSGAKEAVIRQVAGLAPERIVYVGCDPAALARDVGTLRGLGYAPRGIRALDLFPMTHHVETVAVLGRAS